MLNDVLIVEDDRDIRETLAEILAHEGAVARAVCHGGAALDLLQSGYRPDVMVLDLMMPVMDGWSLVAELEKVEEWRRIPIVVLSAVSTQAPPRAFAALRKPADLDALLQAIRAAALNRPS